MAKDGITPLEPSLLARPLAAVTGWVVRFPLATLVAAVALAVLSVMLAHSRLQFKTSRLDLLNPKSGYNKLWIDYIDQFGDKDDAVVVVQGASRQQVVPVLREIAHTLRDQQRHFHAVLHEIDLAKIRGKGLYYLSLDELAGLERLLERVAPIIDGDWSPLNLDSLLASVSAQLAAASDPLQRAETQRHLALLADSLLASLAAEHPDPATWSSPWPQMPAPLIGLSDSDSQFLLANEGRLGFVLLRLAADGNRLDAGSEAIDALRRHLDYVQSRHREVKVGLTGLPVMENDEMRESQRSSLLAGLLSLLGVSCLFVAGLGGVRHPLITIAALLLALAWSLGFVTLAVGHLNILSISFGVILIGLGIDFGIHYVARYLQLRSTVHHSGEALRRTAAGIGPGVVTGGVTTAVAFFTAGLTDFTGVAELGVIAGGGIVLCVAAAVVVLPAMIHLADHRRVRGPLPEPVRIDHLLAPLGKVAGVVLCIGVGVTVVLAVCALRLRYDHNLLNLQADGLESVALERKLLTESDQSVWYALSIADSPAELRARKQQFERLESVQRTEEIVSLLPTGERAKRAVVRRIGGTLAALDERADQIPVDPPEQLGRRIADVQRLLVRGGRVERTLGEIRRRLRAMPRDVCVRELSQFQQRMAGDLLNRLHATAEMAHPEPPRWSDLPASLVTRFVGRRGKHLLKIYATGNIWDMDTLRTFVEQVRGVDPQATGKPLQTYEASRQMQRSYLHAAVYSLFAVLMVLTLDFRHLGYVLLAMVPLALGMAQMFGLMGLLDVPLNPANMIVLPLILGIGIDDGVHIVHDFRCQRGRYRISGSTATAVLLTSLTTMIGFGSLMISAHRGLESLGRVLTIGVSCCMFSSLILLPALLTLLSGRRTEPAGGPAAVTETLTTARVPANSIHRGKNRCPTPAAGATGRSPSPADHAIGPRRSPQ